MARMPTPPAAPAGGAAPDPTMGAGTDPNAGGDDTDTDSDPVVLSITMGKDGTFTVYAGDEPDEGDGGGMSDDDADALGAAGGGPAGGAGAGGAGAMGAMGGAGAGGPQGIPADSIGMALKASMEILTEAASSAGGQGSSDDQFSAGFTGGDAGAGAGGAGAAPGMKQKY